MRSSTKQTLTITVVASIIACLDNPRSSPFLSPLLTNFPSPSLIIIKHTMHSRHSFLISTLLLRVLLLFDRLSSTLSADYSPPECPYPCLPPPTSVVNYPPPPPPSTEPTTSGYPPPPGYYYPPPSGRGYLPYYPPPYYTRPAPPPPNPILPWFPFYYSSQPPRSSSASVTPRSRTFASLPAAFLSLFLWYAI